jgi:outer membrane protein
VNNRWGVFAEVRKAWYHTRATGLLPTDATFTNFADVAAKAELDPLTIQLGATAYFSKRGPEQASDLAPDNRLWMVRAGLSSLRLADRAQMLVGGTPLSGESLSTYEHKTVSVQIGRFVAPNIALNATLGLPPKIDVFGGGSIGALPKLGEVTYGPTAFTAQYHFARGGRIRPYVGAGVSYMIVFGTKDGSFGDLKVKNDLGPAFEVGTDLMVTQRWGLFVDVKKAMLRPKTSGTFMGAPVQVKTRLDPWVFTGGVGFRF